MQCTQSEKMHVQYVLAFLLLPMDSKDRQETWKDRGIMSSPGHYVYILLQEYCKSRYCKKKLNVKCVSSEHFADTFSITVTCLGNNNVGNKHNL